LQKKQNNIKQKNQISFKVSK